MMMMMTMMTGYRAWGEGRGLLYCGSVHTETPHAGSLTEEKARSRVGRKEANHRPSCHTERKRQTQIETDQTDGSRGT